MRFIKTMIEKFLALFKKPEEPVAPQAVTRKKPQRKEDTHWGGHYYLGDLLENLDDAFSAFDVMRKKAPDAYCDLHKIGCAVANSAALGECVPSAGAVMSGLPAFGAVHCGVEKEKDETFIKVKFRYFRKVKRPYNVQQTNSQTFEVGFFYMDDDKLHFHRVFVAVGDDGVCRPLKECAPHLVEFPQKRKRRGQPRATPAFRMRWSLPVAFMEIAEKNGYTHEEMANFLFWSTVNFSRHTDNGLTVRVNNGDSTVAFAVDMERTPYFFADRDKTVNENGSTKRIFHIVRTHQRSNGTWVKSHFRGLRKFNWNGYHVSIGLNGLTSVSMFDFKAAAEEGINETNGGMTQAEVVDVLAEYAEA